MNGAERINDFGSGSLARGCRSGVDSGSAGTATARHLVLKLMWTKAILILETMVQRSSARAWYQRAIAPSRRSTSCAAFRRCRSPPDLHVAATSRADGSIFTNVKRGYTNRSIDA